MIKILKTFWIIKKNQSHPSSHLTSSKKPLLLSSSSALLIFCVFLLIGCGDSSKKDISENLTPHAAININGDTTIVSNLAITSNNYAESAVSVTAGGNLTLNDSTIRKTAPEGSEFGGGSVPGQPSDSDTAPGALEEGFGDASPTAPNQPPNPDIQLPSWAPYGSSETTSSDTSAISSTAIASQSASLTPNSDRAPDPMLAPNTPGPPGTPGGAPPDDQVSAPPGGQSDSFPRSGGGGSDIGSRSSGVYVGSKGSVGLSNVDIETNLSEGKGICAIGNGSSIKFSEGKIETAGHSSHGVFITEGASASLKDVTVTTKGEHSSVLATDTGGGTITAEGGTFTALGKYSSGIYSTGQISAFDATFKSEVDNVAVIEGANQITLTNTSLYSIEKAAVMIYQSTFSGGTSEFKMIGGRITSKDEPIFYVTNTETRIDITGVKFFSSSGIVLKVLKGDWGSDVPWANPTRGGTVEFIADKQTLTGDIILDENSSITATLKNNSSIKGAINADNNGKKMNLMLDASSVWDVTDDSYLDTLILPYELTYDSIPNIIGNGNTVYYNKDNSGSNLGGKSYNLAKGGKLQPK